MENHYVEGRNEDVKGFGAMDVLKLEMTQLESDTEKLVAKLGSEVYTMLMKKRCNTLSRNTPAIRGILKGIEGLQEQNELKKKTYLSIHGWLAVALAAMERP